MLRLDQTGAEGVFGGPRTAFGALLRGHRQAAGLTIAELAERTGLSTRGIADLERGARRSPYRDTLQRLEQALQLDDRERVTLHAAARRVAALPAAEAPPNDIGSTRLSTPLTSFVGRRWEVAEVLRLLQTTRLLTLAGTGGIGKTRLAVEVAATVAGEREGGVTFVDLAPLTEPALVPHTLARALYVRERPNRSVVDALAGAVGARAMLIVLDNCEQVVAACGEVAETLLRACPALQILATSREPLGIAGETTWRVPSLAVPDRQTAGSLESLAQYGAVQLFVERACAVRPDFALTLRNMAAVIEVCRRVDGMPLAIELAAARMRVLSLEEIAARMQDHYRLLAGGSRSAPLRHQTLRATLEWSYVLLDPPERQLFERLSVFVGGFNLQAVEAVCVTEEVTEPEVLDVLTRLVDKSLVLAETAGKMTRYRLLETVRAFARERLADTDVIEATGRQHAAFFLSLAERAEPELDRRDDATWLDRLERDHDNLRAALQWLLEHCLVEEAHRLGAALCKFWVYHGHASEGRAWIEKVLALAAGEHAAARMHALNGAGRLAWALGDPTGALAMHAEALTLARRHEDQQGVAFTLMRLGDLARRRGEYAAARSLLNEALAIGRVAGNQEVEAWSVGALGMVADAEGDFVTARSLGEAALALYTAIGSERGVMLTLRNLGRAQHRLGDRANARRLIEAALARARAVRATSVIASALLLLGELAVDEGEIQQAQALVDESLAVSREHGNLLLMLQSLDTLAKVAAARAQPVQARRFGKAAAALRETLDATPLLPVEHDELDRWPWALAAGSVRT
jgi:predicted ATPase